MIYWVERTKDDMEEFAYQHEEHCRIGEVKSNPNHPRENIDLVLELVESLELADLES